jgi:hypothetical protein
MNGEAIAEELDLLAPAQLVSLLRGGAGRQYHRLPQKTEAQPGWGAAATEAEPSGRRLEGGSGSQPASAARADTLSDAATQAPMQKRTKKAATAFGSVSVSDM